MHIAGRQLRRPAPRWRGGERGLDAARGVGEAAPGPNALASAALARKHPPALGARGGRSRPLSANRAADRRPLCPRLLARYLRKQSLRDFLRVIASDKLSYKLAFYKIEAGEKEDEE